MYKCSEIRTDFAFFALFDAIQVEQVRRSGFWNSNSSSRLTLRSVIQTQIVIHPQIADYGQQFSIGELPLTLFQKYVKKSFSYLIL